MTGSRIANRYAKSFLSLALEQGILETAHDDMRLISTSCEESKELSNFLKSPIIKTDKKQSILKELFKGRVSDITFRFIDIITSKKREIHLEAIAKEFIQKYRTHKNVLTAVITSARGIDEATRNNVIQLLKDEKKSEIELVEKVDDSIIGGFVLTIGDKQVDASISRRLKRLEMSFSENPYVKDY